MYRTTDEDQDHTETETVDMLQQLLNIIPISYILPSTSQSHIDLQWVMTTYCSGKVCDWFWVRWLLTSSSQQFMMLWMNERWRSKLPVPYRTTVNAWAELSNYCTGKAVPYDAYGVQNIVLLYADSCTRVIFGPLRCVRVQIPVTFLLHRTS